MKIVLFGFIFTLFVIFALTSCAADRVSDPQPPVTQLRVEPTPGVPTGLRLAENQIPTDEGIEGNVPYAISQTNPDPASSAPSGARNSTSGMVLAASAVPYPAFQLTDRDWFWSILLLVLLFVLAALQQIRNRRLELVLAQKELALESLEVVVQAPGIADNMKLLVHPDTPLKEIIASAAHRGRFPVQGSFIFLENEKLPLNPHHLIGTVPLPHKVFHVHPQKEITVSVSFNGHTEKMHFSPATTIKKVTAWADYRYKEFDPEVSGVFLAIKGYFAPLVGTAHLGRYVPRDQKHLELDAWTYVRAEVQPTA